MEKRLDLVPLQAEQPVDAEVEIGEVELQEVTQELLQPFEWSSRSIQGMYLGEATDGIGRKVGTTAGACK
jgi:hypothetical protein